MKKISKLLLMTFVAFLFLNSCKKFKDPTIYVKYNWTANLQYYSDDVPVNYKAGDVNAREYQGSVPMAAYSYRYKLLSESTERTGTIMLANSVSTADGENRRKYMIGIYNSNLELTYIDE